MVPCNGHEKQQQQQQCIHALLVQQPACHSLHSALLASDNFPKLKAYPRYAAPCTSLLGCLPATALSLIHALLGGKKGGTQQKAGYCCVRLTWRAEAAAAAFLSRMAALATLPTVWKRAGRGECGCEV